MLPFGTAGPRGYLNKIALLTIWKINDQIPMCVRVLSGVSPHLAC